MDEDQKASLWAASITALAANKAVVRLHALLAAQGTISNQDVEALRHLHLRDFDGPFEHMQHKGAREALDDARAVLDKLWQFAVQADLPKP